MRICQMKNFALSSGSREPGDLRMRSSRSPPLAYSITRYSVSCVLRGKSGQKEMNGV